VLWFISALDAESERQVQDALDRIIKGQSHSYVCVKFEMIVVHCFLTYCTVQVIFFIRLQQTSIYQVGQQNPTPYVEPIIVF